MTYQYTEIKQKDLWDNFIDQNAPQSFFQAFDWGEVQKKLGNHINRYGVYEREKLICIFQSIVVTSKKGNFIHLRHGPVYSASLLPEEIKRITQGIITFCYKVYASRSPIFIRMSPMIDSQSQNIFKQIGCIPSPIHAMDAEYAWVLPLSQSEEELLKNMRKTTRYLVKSAGKNGLEVKKSQDIAAFISLYQETAKRQGFVMHKGLREEFEGFSQTGNADLFLAYQNEVLLSGALIVYSFNQAVYHHGASIETKIPAAYMIQWEAIKEALRRGKKFYNFWGISPENKPNHPWKGITLFKKGFGGEVRQYMHAQDYPYKKWYWITYLLEIVRKMRKGY